jgi:hypothetical protein
LIQGILSLFIFTDHRPLVFSVNGEVLAEVGFAALYPGAAGLIGALTIGVSQSRLPLALLGMAVVLSRSRWIALSFALATSLFVVGTLSVNPSRLTVRQLDTDNELRESLATLSDPTAASVAVTDYRPDLAGKPVDRKWRMLGSGYRNYVNATHASTPHNTYVTMFYELGILAYPLMFAVGFLIAGQLRLWQAATLPLYFLFVDSLYWMPSGVYALGLLAYNSSSSDKSNGVTEPSGDTTPLS